MAIVVLHFERQIVFYFLRSLKRNTQMYLLDKYKGSDARQNSPFLKEVTHGD